MTNLAQQDLSERSARDRVARRLAADAGPSTAASSGMWVDWGGMADFLGQPFNVQSIPLSKLEQMRRDPMIAFGLTFVKVPLIRARWVIESEDAQRAGFIDGALRRIYGRLILAYANCFDFGYSAIVKRFERIQPDWKYLDPKESEPVPQPVWDSGADALVWKAFQPLNPRHASPAWSKDGEFNGIAWRKAGFPQFMADKRADPDIPLERALWATNEKDSVFGSLWGYPRVGYAYRYWWAYWYRFGLADRAFERWADPPVIVYHPTEIGLDTETSLNIDFSSKGLELAESLRSGANVSMPSDAVESLDGRSSQLRRWEAQQMEVRTNFDALNESFRYLDIMKLRSMMVPEQALVEGQGGQSSRNVAAEMGDLFQESQAVVKAEIDDQINRFVIPQLLEANFGPDGPGCRIVTKGFDPADIDTMRAIIQVVGQSEPGKLPVDFRELLKDLGIPTLTPEALKDYEDKQAEAAAATAPDALPAQPGGPGAPQAGVTQQGLYYTPRERIVLMERVDDFPVEVEGAEAYYDEDKRTLFYKDEADGDKIRGFLLGLPQEDASDTTILYEMADRLKTLEDREPNVYVDVISPGEEGEQE